MQLASITLPDLVFPALPAKTKKQVLRFFAERFHRSLELDPDLVFQGLMEREALGSTGIGGGVAIPHCRLAKLSSAVMAVGASRRGIDFDAADGEPVRLFFVVLSPRDQPQENLRLLSMVSSWVRREGNVSELVSMDGRPEMLEMLGRELPES